MSIGHGADKRREPCLCCVLKGYEWRKENDMKDELLDVLKIIADKRMERTFEGLLNEDEEYRKMLKAVHSMELEYDTLELNPDMKTMIDKLLAERDGINMEKTSLAYWAGMMDAIIILRNMEIITV